MRAAVGLLVEADDVHDTNLFNRLGNQVGFGADQVFIENRRVARQKADLDRAIGDQLGVDLLLDAITETLGERIELETVLAQVGLA